MKRAFDLATSAAGLLVLGPFLLLVGLAVLLTSGRPVLFVQERVGLGGRPFKLVKFRTMAVRKGAESGLFEPGSRSRVTPVGRVLRASKIDELPQLWNVLKGEMSLVGPRPEIRSWVEAFPDRWRGVLVVKPGITDPASLRYRNEEEILAAAPDPEAAYRDVILPHKLELYKAYVENRTFWGDLAIIFRTLGRVAK
jgi:lipopolysaccharide/colanic/teichoic acid biosynthesis glycosyltransferase